MTAAGGGRLATLTFAVTSDRPGTTGIISVSRLGYTLLDGTLEEKPVDVSATIKIVIRGDFDGDNQVGFRDFLLFAAAFGSKDAAFDLDVAIVDFDGTVGFSDFVAFARAYGE